MTSPLEPVDSKGRPKVQCAECGEWWHMLRKHLKAKHQMTGANYRARHAGAPMLSAFALEAVANTRSAPIARSSRVDESDPASASILKLGVARLRVRDDVEDEDAVYIPQHDEGYIPGRIEMEQWEAMGVALEAREPVMIVGPTGCGKTSGALELAAVLGQPIQKINLHGDVRSTDFLGEKLIDVDAATGQAVVTWRDSVLPRAMRHGHWLLLDELDAAPPQILFTLQSVLERNGYLTLTANNGEVIRPHPAFRIIATANTLGRGDESGLYAGTNVLNEAFLDRFGVVIEADYPDKETEALILVKRARVRATTAKRMVECATKVREAFTKEQCYCTFSLRRLIAWAEKAKKLGRGYEAAKLTVLNRLHGEDRKFVHGVIERAFPPRELLAAEDAGSSAPEAE